LHHQNTGSNQKNTEMVQLNIKELCRSRGFRHPHAALTKAGISNHVAIDMLKGKKKYLVIKHIEVLCKLLRCAPNDLFTWTPDEPADDYPQNPMQVIRKKQRLDLNEALKGMSLEEIEEMVKGRGKEGE
jgi:DNA-binding Xre family transcriptional regulator